MQLQTLHEIHGKGPEVILEWLDGDESEYDLFHSREWWLKHIGQSDKFEVVMNFDLEISDVAWKDWFMSKHEYASRDEKFFEKGIGQYLATVGFVIRKLIGSATERDCKIYEIIWDSICKRVSVWHKGNRV